MQMIGPLRKELRWTTEGEVRSTSLKYDGPRKAMNSGAICASYHLLPRSGLVQRPLSFKSQNHGSNVVRDGSAFPSARTREQPEFVSEDNIQS